MSRTTYGKSWWGRQWLKALDGIDFSNRLPRGKTYANKGAVLNFMIRENKITAQVQGSYPRPYTQEFILPLFKEEEKQLILDEITKGPHLLSALLNRQLPPELNSLCERNHIPLFPKRWDELEMGCSCPDYAVPCKHLAAVVYKVANEIDLNPFLIFKLHGMDLLEDLKQKGLLIEEHQEELIPNLKDMLRHLPEGEYIYTIENDSLTTPDFSVIEDQSKKIWQLLSNETLFSEKPFKPDLQKAYTQATKQLKKFTKEETGDCQDWHQELQSCDHIHLLLDDKAVLKKLQMDRSENEPQKRMIGLHKLHEVMHSTKTDDLHLYPPAFRFLHSCWRFSIKLIEEKAFIPKLVRMRGDFFTIWWIPAHLLPEVGRLSEQLQHLFPEDFLLFPKQQTVNPEEGLNLLINLFITPLMLEASEKLKAHEKDERLFDCFFARSPVGFPAASSGIPNSIQLWLNKFYIGQKEFMPLIRVEEAGEQFLLTLEVESLKDTNFEAISLADFMEQDKYSRHRLPLLKSLNLLEEFLPQLSQLAAGKEKQLAIDAAHFTQVLLESLPMLEFAGLSVLLPKSLRSLVRPQLSMQISKSSSQANIKSVLHMADLLDFNWKVALGEDWVSPKEFKELVTKSKGLVKRKGRYIHLDPQLIAQLNRQLDRPPKISAAEIIQTAFAENYKDAPILLDQAARELIQEIKTIRSVPLPEGLQAKLRPYQQRGFEWMYKNSRLGLGSLIADDMGLGKTLQVITLLLKLKEEGLFDKKQALIVVPTSLLTNWKKEIEKFAPSLSLSIYHGSKAKIEKDKNLIITTYGKVRSDVKQFKPLKLICLVIDESQNIKNTSTAQTKVIKAIDAKIRIAMSGTPVENRLSEYWSVMDFTNKGYLGSLKKFNEQYAKPIQLEGNQQRLTAFRQITAPFIMRRLKSDKKIISDLPDKIEFDHYCALEKKQAAVYQNVVNDIMQQIEQAQDIQRRGLVLNLLMALKQVCNHPYQYLKKGDNSSEISGKAQVLLNLLDEIRSEREKCLIFTQFRESGELLSQWITECYGRKPLFLHGGTARKQRDRMVEDFQQNPQSDIFILSLKAAGTGLNLTAASKVIHYDLWWNPAVEAQATDRAYRIGQQKEVMVYRLITEGTLEEKIDAMIREKKHLADMTVTSGEKWIGELSNEELKKLV